MAANIKDVAALAGVSQSTASNVLNNKGRVSERTRQKVLAASVKLSYKPNALARSLVTGCSRSVGLMIPDISDPYFTEITKGVEICASAHGYSMILCNTGRDPHEEERYFNILKEKRVDGIIFTGGGVENSRHLLLSYDNAANVVVIGRHGVPFSAIMVDNVRAAQELTDYLVKKGHRRIGFIAGPLSYTVSLDRLEGYRRALALNGLAYEAALVLQEDLRAEGGRRACNHFLDLDPKSRPTAVVGSNDQMAIGALGAAWEKGCMIPGDMAIVGFDDIPMAALTCPPLTTVRLPMRDMGRKAMELMIDGGARTRTGGEEVVRQEFFPTELVIRGTA